MTFNDRTAHCVDRSQPALQTDQSTFKEKVGLLVGRTFHTFAAVAKTIVAIADKIIAFICKCWLSILDPPHTACMNLSDYQPTTNGQRFKQSFFLGCAIGIFIIALPAIKYCEATGRPI